MAAVFAATVLLSLPSPVHGRPGDSEDEPAPRLDKAPKMAPRVLPRPAPAAIAVSATRRCLLESGPVAFGEVEPGVEVEIPGAIRVRVWSDRTWALTLVPETPPCTDGVECAPVSRIAWRTARSGRFVPLGTSRPVTFAVGHGTAGGGELVLVDLRLRLESPDPLGHYLATFRARMEELE